MITYMNLLPIIDECNDYIPTKEGRYIIVQTHGNIVYLMNINSGAQGAIAKEYFDKEFEPCE
jgi:hypothetical protein